MPNINKIKNIIKDKIEDIKYKIRNQLEPEDIEFVRDLTIAFILSGILVISSIFILMFIFFYGSPWIIIWSILLILLKFRFCESGFEVSLEDFLKKHFKITITFT